MKVITYLFMFSIFFVNDVFADCATDVNNVFVYGTQDVLNHGTCVNAINTENNCGWTYGGNPANLGHIIFKPVAGYSTWMPNWVETYLDETQVNLEGLLELMYNDTYFTGPTGLLNANGGLYFDIEIKHVMSVNVYYIYTVRVYHAYNAQITTDGICSGVPYTFNELFSGVPNAHTNRTIVSSEGDNFNGNNITFSQPVTNTITIMYQADVGGVVIRRYFDKTIGTEENAFFTSTAQSGGAITNLDPATLMTDYILISGGIPEFWGNGLVQNGNDFWFDPNVAIPGNNIVYVRSNNNGCLSDWRDTIFVVTPIVVNFNSPQTSFMPAFGDEGFHAGENTNGTPTIAGKFHYGCAGATYPISFMPGSLAPGLTIDWQIVFHYNVIDAGTSNGGFQVTMPSSNEVLLNQVSSLYTVEDHLLDNTLLYNLLVGYGAGDITGNGTVDNDDFLATRYTGDLVKIMTRARNVFNDVSDWRTTYIGLVPTPEHDESLLKCYVGDPVMDPVTNTPIYYDSIDYDTYRSVRWDVNNDGTWDLDGSQDNYNLIMTTIQKNDVMRSQIIDSTYLYGYNLYMDDFYETYSDLVSTVCYSEIDTIDLVRQPVFTTNFSEMDTVDIGNAVEGIVTGTWFDSELDSITWNWSDGSPTYFGDSTWHFMNDLGSYSLEVAVIDSFGCVSDSLYLNAWYVDGVLNLNEEISDDLKVYPVPVVNTLTIESDTPFDMVEIISVTGELVYSKSGNLGVIDLDYLDRGTYVVRIYTDYNLITRKIVKK